MNELVERLSTGKHPVEASLRPERTVGNLKECIDRGYVHIKFTGTRGGTELGVRLDDEETDLSGANFGDGTGKVHLVGKLTLNYEKVQCVADIDLDTLDGEGFLKPEPETAAQAATDAAAEAGAETKDETPEASGEASKTPIANGNATETAGAASGARAVNGDATPPASS